MLKQIGPWTVGGLANHLWSFAGAENRQSVNATFLQPFATYVTKKGTSFTLNTEATYDWNANGWTVPVNAGVAQMLKVKDHLIQVALFGRYYFDRPIDGPDWGLRFQIALLFPK